MSDPFIGEIRIFGFNFAPTGWALCNGQLLPISQNTALFSILGTSYGGDGYTTFALPNLQGSAPIHQGQGPGLTPRVIGETGGEPTVTLQKSEMPMHNHPVGADTSPGGNVDPTAGIWATAGRGRPQPYSTNPPSLTTPMSQQALGQTGGILPHNNLPPFLTLNFCIALQGIYPPRN